jgi:hypothetical protein
MPFSSSPTICQPRKDVRPSRDLGPRVDCPAYPAVLGPPVSAQVTTASRGFRHRAAQSAITLLPPIHHNLVFIHRPALEIEDLRSIHLLHCRSHAQGATGSPLFPEVQDRADERSIRYFLPSATAGQPHPFSPAGRAWPFAPRVPVWEYFSANGFLRDGVSRAAPLRREPPHGPHCSPPR